MSRILILANHSGGLYDFRGELPRRLIAAGNEVAASVPDETKTKELEADGVRIIHTDLDRRGVNPAKDLCLVREYRALLKKERPDLVLTYTIKPNIYGGFVCSRLGIPYIATVTGLGSTFERGGALLRLIVFMYRAGLRKAACVVFQNAENKAVFARYGIRGRKSLLVSGSGVDLQVHRQAPYPGHEGAQTVFLYVGRIMREKGIDEYLEAAKRLHAEYGERAAVKTIGFCDEDYSGILQRAQEEGYLESLPFDRNITPHLVQADAVVLPSYHEGMSNTLMEAAATGRPVLASDISGCREIVDDGQSGFLFKARDAQSLYEAMCRFMETPPEKRRAMGIAGRQKMEREFDRNKVMDAYMQEIREALQQKV